MIPRNILNMFSKYLLTIKYDFLRILGFFYYKTDVGGFYIKLKFDHFWEFNKTKIIPIPMQLIWFSIMKRRCKWKFIVLADTTEIVLWRDTKQFPHIWEFIPVGRQLYLIYQQILQCQSIFFCSAISNMFSLSNERTVFLNIYLK
jgi:hypothetical protein